MKDHREVIVVFAEEKLKGLFERLRDEHPELYKFVSRAIDDLKENPFHPIDIQVGY